MSSKKVYQVVNPKQAPVAVNITPETPLSEVSYPPRYRGSAELTVEQVQIMKAAGLQVR